jgi:hypothetical protein
MQAEDGIWIVEQNTRDIPCIHRALRHSRRPLRIGPIEGIDGAPVVDINSAT